MTYIPSIKSNHPEVKQIAKKCYPDYKGRKFSIKISTYPVNCQSYWSGGSRDYFKFYNLDTKLVSSEIPQQSAFDKSIPELGSVEVRKNLMIVRHSYFCGKDSGITLIVHPDNSPRLLD